MRGSGGRGGEGRKGEKGGGERGLFCLNKRGLLALPEGARQGGRSLGVWSQWVCLKPWNPGAHTNHGEGTNGRVITGQPKASYKRPNGRVITGLPKASYKRGQVAFSISAKWAWGKWRDVPKKGSLWLTDSEEGSGEVRVNAIPLTPLLSTSKQKNNKRREQPGLFFSEAGGYKKYWTFYLTEINCQF